MAAIRLDALTDDFLREQTWHKPVRVATTANITISTGLNAGDTIDGVTLAAGDRVLVKDQSTASQNGIYTAGATPERAYDMLAGIQAQGAVVYVIDGTANGGKAYVCTVLTLPTIGSSSLVWAEFTGSTGGGSLDVSDGSTTVSPTSLLSFDPASFDVTDLGSGEAFVEFTGSPGGGSDPTIPAGGTLYDGTDLTGFTGFGSLDTLDADTTIPGNYYMRKATMGGNNLVGAHHAISSLPRTITMRIRDAFMHADFQGVNVLVGEASPGKFWSWGYVRDGVSNKYHQRYAWTTAASSGANQNFNGGVNIANPAQWYRIVVNSSTDIELWHSYNGYIYYRYAAAQNPSFTIGTFGFGMYTFAAIEMKAAIAWIHES